MAVLNFKEHWKIYKIVYKNVIESPAEYLSLCTLTL